MTGDSLKEILEGYVEARQKAVAINAIGETGLNVRLFAIFNLQAFVMSLYRSQHHRVVRHFQDMYFFAYQTAQGAWLTELLRVMDRPRAWVRSSSRENLTVPLFHERFQASPTINARDREDEQTLYDILHSSYDSNGFRDFRNKRMFHLDLAENLKKPAASGNLDTLTDHFAWVVCSRGWGCYRGRATFHHTDSRLARN